MMPVWDWTGASNDVVVKYNKNLLAGFKLWWLASELSTWEHVTKNWYLEVSNAFHKKQPRRSKIWRKKLTFFGYSGWHKVHMNFQPPPHPHMLQLLPRFPMLPLVMSTIQNGSINIPISKLIIRTNPKRFEVFQKRKSNVSKKFPKSLFRNHNISMCSRTF